MTLLRTAGALLPPGDRTHPFTVVPSLADDFSSVARLFVAGVATLLRPATPAAGEATVAVAAEVDDVMPLAAEEERRGGGRGGVLSGEAIGVGLGDFEGTGQGGGGVLGRDDRELAALGERVGAGRREAAGRGVVAGRGDAAGRTR